MAGNRDSLVPAQWDLGFSGYDVLVEESKIVVLKRLWKEGWSVAGPEVSEYSIQRGSLVGLSRENEERTCRTSTRRGARERLICPITSFNLQLHGANINLMSSGMSSILSGRLGLIAARYEALRVIASGSLTR